jgi:hypothetical protein
LCFRFLTIYFYFVYFRHPPEDSPRYWASPDGSPRRNWPSLPWELRAMSSEIRGNKSTEPDC